MMQVRVWSIKAGKISKNRNKQTSVQEHKKNCTVPERKEIRAVCVLTPRSFSHSQEKITDFHFWIF